MLKPLIIFLLVFGIFFLNLFGSVSVYAQTNQPDLEVKSVTFDSQKKATIEVINKGNAELYSAKVATKERRHVPNPVIKLRYLRSDFNPNPQYLSVSREEKLSIPSSPINAGSSFKITSNLIPSANATHIEVTLDNENAFIESNETNNITLQILPEVTEPIKRFADLKIKSTIFDTNKRPTVTVENSGTAAVYDSLKDPERGRNSVRTPSIRFVYGKMDSIYTDRFTPISHNPQTFTLNRPFSVGSTQSFTPRIDPLSNATHIQVEVDYQDDVIEIDEDNSQIIALPGIATTTTQLSDLAITSFTLDPVPTVTFTNKGTVDAHTLIGDWRQNERGATPKLISFSYLQSSYGPENALSAVGKSEEFEIPKPFLPGASQTYSIKNPIPTTATHVKVSLDVRGAVRELEEESNNSQVLELAPGDLVIESLTQAKEGKAATLLVKNIGDRTIPLARDIIQISYNVSDQTINRDLHAKSNIKTGETLSFQINIPVGSTEITAHLDPNNYISESNNENNTIKVTLTLPTPTEIVKNLEELAVKRVKESTLSASTIPIVSNIADIKVSPCSPFSFFKKIGQGMESALTFSQEEKVKRSISNANEKVVESLESVSKNNSECAANILTEAADDITKANKMIDDLSQKSPEQAQELAIISLDEQFLQQKIVGDIIQGASGNSLIKTKQARSKTLENLANSIEKVKDKEKIKSVLKTNKEKDTAFSPFSNLEVLVAVEDKISDDKKEVLLEAKKDTVTQTRQILQSLPQDKQDIFSAYVKGVGGEEVNKLKVLDEIRRSNISEDTIPVLLGAKKEVSDSFEVKIQEASKKDKNALGVLLSDLKDGSLSDLRIVSELDDTKNKDVQTKLTPVKEQSIKSFVENTQSQSEEKKAVFKAELAQEYLDSTQIEVIKEIQATLPQESLGQELEETLKSQISSSLARLRSDKTQYDEFISNFIDDSADDIELVEDFVEEIDKVFASDLIREQIETIKEYYEFVDDEDQEELKQKIFTDEKLNHVFDDYDPSYDQWVKDQTEEDSSTAEERDENSFQADEEIREEEDSSAQQEDEEAINDKQDDEAVKDSEEE